MELYRGTQTSSVKGVREALSYTPSLPVAIIWSAHPGDTWGNLAPHFLPTSTVHRAKLNTKKILELSEYTHATFGRILRKLKYGRPGGIDDREALKILQYMHNRIIGKARGGEFKYAVLDEEGEHLDPEEVPLSFTDPVTLISEVKDEFQSASFDGIKEALTVADRIEADTFIFADAPAVTRAALKLGYEVMWYPDVFAGGEFGAPPLLGMNVEDLQGVEMDYDIEDDEIATHDTYRPLVEGAVIPVESVLTSELLREVDASELKRAG